MVRLRYHLGLGTFDKSIRPTSGNASGRDQSSSKTTIRLNRKYHCTKFNSNIASVFCICFCCPELNIQE